MQTTTDTKRPDARYSTEIEEAARARYLRDGATNPDLPNAIPQQPAKGLEHYDATTGLVTVSNARGVLATYRATRSAAGAIRLRRIESR